MFPAGKPAVGRPWRATCVRVLCREGLTGVSETERCLEALYRSRDLVGEAVSEQDWRSRPSLDELHAVGSAIVSNLVQLGHLSSALAEHVDRIDQAQLARAKLSNRPEDQLRLAGAHLHTLSQDLATAIADAHRYWAAMQQADVHTRSEYTPPSQRPDT